MNAFCATRRKGLRRIWNIPNNTHCALLSLLCGLLPLIDELDCRGATLTYLLTCEVISFVARHDVYFRRMLSPIGRKLLVLL